MENERNNNGEPVSGMPGMAEPELNNTAEAENSAPVVPDCEAEADSQKPSDPAAEEDHGEREPATEAPDPDDQTFEAEDVDPAATSAPEDEGEPLATARAVEELGASLIAIQNEISALSRQNEVLKKLQAENEAYRGDVVAKVLRPIVNELVQMHVNYSRQLEGIAKRGDAVDLKTLEGFVNNLLSDIEYTLEDSGIDKLEMNNLDQPFDAKHQSFIGEVPTEDPNRDGCVAALVRPGFTKDGNIVQKERVRLYRLTQQGADT